MAKRPDGEGFGARGGGRSETRAVYIISVAAELAGVHPQTLRIYERKGLLRPARTAGNTRRYSERDIAQLQTIQRLTQEFGINLAGVKMIVGLEQELDRTRQRMQRLEGELLRVRRQMREELRRAEDRPSSEMVPAASLRRLLLQLGVTDQEPPVGRPGRRGPIAVGPGG